MTDPISTLRKDPEDLARHILERLAIEHSEMNGAVSMAADLIRALADSIKMMEPATFLNSITLWREKDPAANGPSIVQGIVSMLEETVMEWDLMSRQTRFLWNLFHKARSQFVTVIKKEDDNSQVPGSEQFLADIADRIPGVIYQFYVKPDSTMGVSYVSGRSREILGVDPGLSERFPSFLSHLAPWCKDSFLESVHKAVANESDWEFEGEYIKDSGESMFFTGKSTPIKIGDTVQFNGVILDITARRLAEEKLTDSERKFSVIADLMPQVIFEIDEKGNVVFVNKQAFEFFGYEESDFPYGFICFDHIVPEDYPRLMKDLENVALGTASPGNEYTAIKKDGTRFPVIIYVSRIMQNDRLTGCCGIIVDITQRKKAEEALRESEERWQFALEGSGDGLWDWDVPNNKVYFSKQWKEMIGFAEDEIVDSIEEWDSRVHPDDKADVYAKLNEHLEGRSPVYISQHRLQSKDGTYKWILDRGKVLTRAEDGKPLRVIGTHTDITERKHLESQLLQSQKMEAVGTLAGGVAHDFNNLLSAIMGYASLLQMKMDKHDPLYSYASHILTSSEKAANLTQSLLAFSRKQVIDLKPIALNDTVEKLHRLLERLIPEDVEFRVNKSDERLVVMADVGRLDQVIMNLVTNARDAMPRGGKLSIRIDRAAANSTFMTTNKNVDLSDHALIEISDTGDGMDKTTIEKIFEPFFTTKELGRGTGLGLSIVYGIIKQHNGYIDVRSQPGEGSVFSVYLPIAWLEPEDENDVSQIVGGIETILIAEDNKELCQLSMRVLRDHGYSVLAAIDGSMAVEMFRDHKGEIALVFLDVVMPKMNGKEAYEIIRKIDPSVKVIFTSGYTDDIVIERGVENEQYDFLGKPLTPATLLTKVREVLDRKS